MVYSFLDLAKEVLEHENIPLSVGEMWEVAAKHGSYKMIQE